MLTNPDNWIWDSWIADDGDTYHLYFLQAPRSLGEPDRRHAAARIGHATSTDLVRWNHHGEALSASPPGSWDDLSTWTGCTVQGDDGVWRMYYTGVTAGPHGPYEQRIGLAESADLFTWSKVGDAPVVSADPRWYATFGDASDPGASETWRDPFVFRDPDGNGWHMYLTARMAGATRLDDGVLAHAWSSDMMQWEVLPPVSTPARFGQLEVPQVHLVDGQSLLVFTCHPQEQDVRRMQEYGEFCTWSTTGPALTGPWDIAAAKPLVAEPDLFAAPLVRNRDGDWVFIGFVNLEPKGVNSFHIIDPIGVELGASGLTVAADHQSVGRSLLEGGGSADRPVAPVSIMPPGAGIMQA